MKKCTQDYKYIHKWPRFSSSAVILRHQSLGLSARSANTNVLFDEAWGFFFFFAGECTQRVMIDDT